MKSALVLYFTALQALNLLQNIAFAGYYHLGSLPGAFRRHGVGGAVDARASTDWCGSACPRPSCQSHAVEAAAGSFRMGPVSSKVVVLEFHTNSH